MSEQQNRVEQAANAPRRARTAAGEVETHQLADQIAADKYLASRRIANPFGAIRLASFVPPAATGDYPGE